MRLLPNTVRGPKNFRDLRTFRGNVASSFKQACKDLHLLEDGNHWIMCMSEASETHHSSAIRVPFAVLLASCQLTDTLQLWMRFRNDTHAISSKPDQSTALYSHLRQRFGAPPRRVPRCRLPTKSKIMHSFKRPSIQWEEIFFQRTVFLFPTDAPKVSHSLIYF